MDCVWEIYVKGMRGTHAPLYKVREDAERVAMGIAEKAHAENVKWHLLEIEQDPDHFSEEAKDWWRGGQRVVVISQSDQTFYGCGEPEWRMSDQRTASYVHVVRRVVA